MRAASPGMDAPAALGAGAAFAAVAWNVTTFTGKGEGVAYDSR